MTETVWLATSSDRAIATGERVRQPSGRELGDEAARCVEELFVALDQHPRFQQWRAVVGNSDEGGDGVEPGAADALVTYANGGGVEAEQLQLGRAFGLLGDVDLLERHPGADHELLHSQA